MTLNHCVGPVGDIVRHNIRRLRKARGLSTKELASSLTEHGKQIWATAITRVEHGQRRVDVDDLVAIAAALGATVAQLLEPPTDCASCQGTPPPGFTCRSCGAEA